MVVLSASLQPSRHPALSYALTGRCCTLSGQPRSQVSNY